MSVIREIKKMRIINAFIHTQIKTNMITLLEDISKTYNENILVVIRYIFTFKAFSELSEEDIRNFKDRFFRFAYELQRIGKNADALIDNINRVNIQGDNISLATNRKIQRKIEKIQFYSEIYHFYKERMVYKEGIPELYNKYSNIVMILLDKNVTKEYKQTLLEEFDELELLNISKVILGYFDSKGLEKYANDLNEINLMVLRIYNEKLESKKRAKKERKSISKPNSRRYNSENYIQYYLSSGMTKLEWITKIKSSLCTFNSYLKTIQQNNPKLYKDYLEHQKNENNMLIRLVELISYYYENGVDLGNGKKRKFTIIDYYCITSIPIYIFARSIKNLNVDYKILNNARAFVRSYLNSTRLNETSINNLTIYANFGSQKRYLLEEEVKEIIAFFKENDIPLEGTTFTSFVSDYAAGRMLLPTHMKR